MATDADAPGGVDIRILGPLELVLPPEPGAAAAAAPPTTTVSLGGPRQRTVFGLLSLWAPGISPVSVLVDGVWGGDPPPSAVRTLHAHVAYLRRALQAAGLRGLIVTRPPGYILDTTRENIDAHRFDAMVRRGRSALSAGRPDEAGRWLRAALGLWRGDVLADCQLGDRARADATRLEQARLHATEDLFRAELATGRYAPAAVELEALTAHHPLQERLWELLMLAQYRSGRQGEALNTYRRVRSVLDVELGVEPGPGLRRMQALILAGDDPAPEPPWWSAHNDTSTSGTASTSGTPSPPGTIAIPGGVGGEPAGAVPVPITSLVGRADEIAELLRLIAERRLITLTGVGGCGKTRLAIAVAGALATDPGSGVRFVDLSAQTSGDTLPVTVAAGVGVAHQPDLSPVEALVRELRQQRLLLVLDNCEDLAADCAALIEALLRGCPLLRVLATSRHPLGVPGETAWPVPPLSLPPLPVPEPAAPRRPAGTPAPPGPLSSTRAGGDLAELRRYGAVQLFLDRAAAPAVRGLTVDDLGPLATVCAALDGLPLAIELAAARTSVLTVREIAARIHDPQLLSGRSGAQATERDRRAGPGGALHQAIAWSYELLNSANRARFRRLSVFAGGFTIDAVAALWSYGGEDPIDEIANLIDKSLVVVGYRPDGARYRLLETLRRFATAQLDRDPAEAAEARARHAAYYRALAEEIDGHLSGPDLDRLLDRMAAEHDNLRSALAWYAAGEPCPAELRFAADLARYCHLRGRYGEGRHWLESALARHRGSPDADLARAQARAARLAFFECDYPTATRYGESALRTYQALGDQAGTARSLSLLGSVARERGHYGRSSARYTEAVRTYRAAGDDEGIATMLQMAGFTSWLTGDLTRAQRLLTQALGRFRRLDDPEGTASAQVHLAAVAHYQGDQVRASMLASEALAGFRSLGFEEGIAWALNIIGLVEYLDGALPQAAESLRASLRVHCAVGDRWRAASVLEALAAVLAGGPDVTTAAELFGAATAIRSAIGTPVPPQERAGHAATEATLRSALPARVLAAALSRGAALRLRDLPTTLDGPETSSTGN